MFGRIVYWLLGILEALLAFRLVFKFLGSDSGGTFVSFIYTYSGPFVTPFSGIIKPAVTQGMETTTIIGMIVYALIGYGIIRLIEILGNR
jgi:hypothetical protein